MRRALSTLAVLAMLLLPALPAAAQAGEQITHYGIDMQVAARTGYLTVTERIDYDFGINERHGIFRKIPVRFQYDDRYDRVYPVDVISVTGSPGTPVEYETSNEDQNLVIKIGDPDKTISGRHTYTIVYGVEGALNGFEDHDELYWNAIGFEWPVTIQGVDATLTAPAGIQRVACFAGPRGSNLPCNLGVAEGDKATFAHPQLSPGEALTVVVAIPKGAVNNPEPVLDERWSAGRAFSVTPLTVAGSLAIMGALLAFIYRRVFVKGRDKRFAGSPVDAAMATSGLEEPVGLLERPAIPVEYLPPDNLRPGQVGMLVDETANPLDVIATIVDLAVRGYLRIDEIPKEGWLSKADWTLHRLRDDAEGLKEYETLLIDSLFSGGKKEVQLSDLEDKFAPKLKKVQDALYNDAVKQGWFKARPDTTRTIWTVIGVLATVVGVIVLILAMAFTKVALLAVPFPIAGFLIAQAAHRMPSRTAKGTALVRRVKGFRKFIEESEADRAQFAERQNLFSEYLPYAVVFGATKQWAKRFEGLNGELPAQNWYVGYGGHPFTTTSFSRSMNGFATTTAGTIASTPSSSGSSGFSGGGFSGGGGGGGGGGSW